jgi:hypothetical protein
MLVWWRGRIVGMLPFIDSLTHFGEDELRREKFHDADCNKIFYSLVCVEGMKKRSTLHAKKRDFNKLVLFYYVSSNYGV